MRVLLLAVSVLMAACAVAPRTGRSVPLPELGVEPSVEQLGAFARLALDGLVREYPNKPSNVMGGPEDVLAPRAMHPAFYGSFDWHSAVHGHWMLVRLLKLAPGAPFAADARAVLTAHLSAENLAAEAAYFERKDNRSFERTYGWAWLLRLAAELRGWDDPQGRVWAANLRPLEERLVGLAMDYLPKLTWPIRVGEHPNTAWALAEFLDYARATGHTALERLAGERARAYYLADRAYPVDYEPSGNDFFSPGLLEADLMRRVLPPAEYSSWLDAFLPGLRGGALGNLGIPVEVSDPTDGKLVHLAGLNLVRAWTQRGISSALPADDPRRAVLLDAAAAHARAGLGYVFSGHYEGEHWLASFAIYLLTDAGLAATG